MGRTMRRLQAYQQRDAPFDCTRAELVKVMNAFGGRCAYCGEDISTLYYFDHVVPTKRGGPTIPANLVPCCRPCNEKKNACAIIDLMQTYPERLAIYGHVLAHCLSARGSEMVIPMLEAQMVEAVCEEVPF